jgi:hypothetical protein
VTWCVPVPATTVNLTESPGLCPAMLTAAALASATRCPSMAVITSPAERPAAAAGDPELTFAILAPPAASFR